MMLDIRIIKLHFIFIIDIMKFYVDFVHVIKNIILNKNKFYIK